jgi:hypothetical protein
MKETIAVTYERKLSDGNLGSEALSITLSLVLHDDELAEECLNDGTVRGIVKRVRAAVLGELACSGAPHVAAAAAAELGPSTENEQFSKA